MSDNETELRRRYPTTTAPEPPRRVETIDPELIRRYPSMASEEQRAEAARALAPEIQPPPEIDAQGADFAAFKRAAQATGLDNPTASKLLGNYVRELKR